MHAEVGLGHGIVAICEHIIQYLPGGCYSAINLSLSYSREILAPPGKILYRYAHSYLSPSLLARQRGVTLKASGRFFKANSAPIKLCQLTCTYAVEENCKKNNRAKHKWL